MAQGVRARLTAAQGRKFGLTVGFAFLALGGVLWWRDHRIFAFVAWALGGALVLAALVAPTALGPVERAWMAMALAISKVMNPLVMGIVYFLVLLPIGVGMRLLGRNPIVRVAQSGSYWADRSQDRSGRGGMERQF